MDAPRACDVSYKQQCSIHVLRFSAGWTLQEIADNRGLPVVSTGEQICQGHTTPQKKSRVHQKVKINSPQGRQLIALAILDAKHCKMSYLVMAQELGIESSKKTLRNAFAKRGSYRQSAGRKPYKANTKYTKQLRFSLSHSH